MMNPEIIWSIYLAGLSIALPLTILLNLQENGLKRNIRKGSQIGCFGTLLWTTFALLPSLICVTKETLPHIFLYGLALILPIGFLLQLQEWEQSNGIKNTSFYGSFYILLWVSFTIAASTVKQNEFTRVHFYHASQRSVPSALILFTPPCSICCIFECNPLSQN